MKKRKNKVYRINGWSPVEGITASTKFAAVAPFVEYLADTTRASAKAAAVAKYGDTWALSIGDLLAGCSGDFSCIGADVKNPVELLALQYFWVEAFREMVEQLTKTLEALAPPQSPEAKNAAGACKKLSFKESTLIFLRDYFGLHSFAEAQALHLDDLLLAKKDKYNQAAFERALASIHDQKLKTKK